MTEDDTFNKLKQIPLRDIVNRLYSLTSTEIRGTDWYTLRRKLLQENNYTMNEYLSELSRAADRSI